MWEKEKKTNQKKLHFLLWTKRQSVWNWVFQRELLSHVSLTLWGHLIVFLFFLHQFWPSCKKADFGSVVKIDRKTGGKTIIHYTTVTTGCFTLVQPCRVQELVLLLGSILHNNNISHVHWILFSLLTVTPTTSCLHPRPLSFMRGCQLLFMGAPCKGNKLQLTDRWRRCAVAMVAGLCGRRSTSMWRSECFSPVTDVGTKHAMPLPHWSGLVQCLVQLWGVSLIVISDRVPRRPRFRPFGSKQTVVLSLWLNRK